MEKWRTETEGSHRVAKRGTRKKEESLKGNAADDTEHQAA
jgi:hypothetical protein